MTVYNTSFVYFDDTGTVHGISNIISEQFKNFEIDNVLVEDFYTYKKILANYNIEYFYNLSKGVIELEQEQKIIDSNLSLQMIPRTVAYNNEVTIEHDLTNKEWILKFRDDIIDKFDIISKLVFFVTKNNDPYFLYRSFVVVSTDKNLIKVKFETEKEHNLKKISLFTIKKFNSYGVKEVA